MFRNFHKSNDCAQSWSRATWCVQPYVQLCVQPPWDPFEIALTADWPAKTQIAFRGGDFVAGKRGATQVPRPCLNDKT